MTAAREDAQSVSELERIDHLLSQTFPRLSIEAFFDPESGGFHERLDASLQPLRTGKRRLLVQCRQIFVLALAHERGVENSGETAARAIEFLLEYLDDEHGGWYFALDEEGREPVDTTKDSYAHAFVVFALSQFARVTGDASALTLADETLAAALTHFSDPLHGGFFETTSRDWVPSPAMRRQNPHMHWLEAALSRLQLSDSPDALTVVREVVRLLESSFYDESSRTLREFFTDDWKIHPESGDVVEPGHHFEWAWLLDEACESIDLPPKFLELSRQLHDWAVRHGCDPESGQVLDEVSPSGTVLRATRRIWPQCERLKSLARRAISRPGERLELLRAYSRFEEDFLTPRGTWIEHRSNDGSVWIDDLPGSTSYHIVLALTEVENALRPV